MVRMQVRVHFHYSLAKPERQPSRGRKFGVAVAILPLTASHLPRTSYLGKLSLDALLSLEGPDQLAPNWKIPLQKIKINLKAGGTMKQVAWALEPKKPPCPSKTPTDLVSDQSQNTPIAPTLQLGSAQLERLSSEL